MLQPIEHVGTAADACARALRAAIVRGELPAGARLPGERELAASLGVNRGTLRTALRELSQAGLLSVQHGAGYVVRDYRATGGPDLVPALAELARHHGDLHKVARDLLLVRRHLAAALLEALGRRRPSRALLRALEEAVAAFAALAATTPLPSTLLLARADLAVVQALVNVTQSPVLALFVNPIGALLASLPELREAIYRAPAANAAGYAALLEGLRAWPTDLSAALSLLAERDEATLARLGSPQRRPR